MEEPSVLLERIRTLEEREQSLLMAAEIGKTLLEKNIELSNELETIWTAHRTVTEQNGHLQQKLLFSESEKESASRRVAELEQELSDREVVVKELKKRMQTGYVSKEKYQQLQHEMEFVKSENQRVQNEQKELRRQLSSGDGRVLAEKSGNERQSNDGGRSDGGGELRSKESGERSKEVQKMSEVNRKLNEAMQQMGEEMEKMKEQLVEKEKLAKSVSSLLKANRQLQEEHEEYKRLLKAANERLAEQKEVAEDKRMSDAVMHSMDGSDSLEVEIEEQVANLVKQQSELILKDKRDELNRQLAELHEKTQVSERTRHEYEQLMAAVEKARRIESRSIGIQTESVELEVEPQTDPLLISQLQDEVSKVRGEFGQVMQSLEEESDKFNRLQAEHFVVQNQVVSLQQNESELKRKLNQSTIVQRQVEQQRDEWQQKSIAQQKECEQLRQALNEQEKVIGQLKGQSLEATKRLADLQVKLTEAHAIEESLKREIESIRSEEQRRLEQLMEAANEMQVKQQQQLQQEQQAKSSLEQLTSVQVAEFERLQRDFEQIRTQSSNQQSELLSCQVKLVQQQQQVHERTKQLSQLQAEIATQSATIEQLRAEVDQVRNEEKQRFKDFLRKRRLHDELAAQRPPPPSSPIAERRKQQRTSELIVPMPLTLEAAASEPTFESAVAAELLGEAGGTGESGRVEVELLRSAATPSEEVQYSQLMENLEKETETRTRLQEEIRALQELLSETETKLMAADEQVGQKQRELEQNEQQRHELESEKENQRKQLQLMEIDRDQTRKLINDLMREKQERSRLLTTIKNEWEEDRVQQRKQLEQFQHRLKMIENKKMLLEQQSKKFERQLLDLLDKHAESKAYEEDIMQSIIRFREYIQDAQSTVLSQKMHSILQREEMYLISNTVLESVMTEAKILLSRQGEAKMYGRSKEWVCQLYELLLNCAEMQLRANKMSCQLQDETLAKTRLQEQLDALKKPKKKGLFW